MPYKQGSLPIVRCTAQCHSGSRTWQARQARSPRPALVPPPRPSLPERMVCVRLLRKMSAQMVSGYMTSTFCVHLGKYIDFFIFRVLRFTTSMSF